MSLPWIRVYNDLPDHPKADALAELLGEARAWTHVVELWLWASRVRPDGDLAGIAPSLIARRSGWTGEPEQFVSALRVAGWLDGTRLHGWEEHQGAHSAKLARDRERLRAARHPASVAASVATTVAATVAPTVATGVAASVAATVATTVAPTVARERRGEERREEQELAADAAPPLPASPEPAPVAEPVPAQAPQTPRQGATAAPPEASPAPALLASPEPPARRRAPEQPNTRTERLAWLAEYRRLVGLSEAAAPDTRDLALRWAAALKPAGRTPALLVEALRGALSDPWWRDKAPLQLLSESAITGGLARARAGPPKARSHAATAQVNDLWRDHPTPTPDTPAEWEAA